MRFVSLGSNGLRISQVGLGTCYGFADNRESENCIAAALDVGITFFDTADVYDHGRSEELLGKVLRQSQNQEIVVATKCYFPMPANSEHRGLSRKHITRSVENSLRRLRRDRIDLLQCHRFDESTPLEETIQAMGDLIKAGKIRSWGVSRWNADDISAMATTANQTENYPAVSNQFYYHMLNTEIETSILPTCTKKNVAILAYSPLAQGVLSGKYEVTEPPPINSRAASTSMRPNMWELTPENLSLVNEFARIARDHDYTLPQLALQWCLRPGAASSVIIGASKAEQVLENCRFLHHAPLNATIITKIESIQHGKH